MSAATRSSSSVDRAMICSCVKPSFFRCRKKLLATSLLRFERRASAGAFGSGAPGAEGRGERPGAGADGAPG
jgi:hypothetical protein